VLLRYISLCPLYPHRPTLLTSSNTVHPARPVTLSTRQLFVLCTHAGPLYSNPVTQCNLPAPSRSVHDSSLSSVPTLARFTRIHKYNNVQRILLLFNVGNVLLCVIYQLNFIIGMYVNEKRLTYRVRYYPRFRASAVGLGTYHPRIRGGGTTVLAFQDELFSVKLTY
jgi:hypothetical protein